MSDKLLAHSPPHEAQGTTHRAPSENSLMRYRLTLPVKNVLLIVSLASLLHIGYTSVDVELTREQRIIFVR